MYFLAGSSLFTVSNSGLLFSHNQPTKQILSSFSDTVMLTAQAGPATAQLTCPLLFSSMKVLNIHLYVVTYVKLQKGRNVSCLCWQSIHTAMDSSCIVICRRIEQCTLDDFTFWISLSLRPNFGLRPNLIQKVK